MATQGNFRALDFGHPKIIKNKAASIFMTHGVYNKKDWHSNVTVRNGKDR